MAADHLLSLQDSFPPQRYFQHVTTNATPLQLSPGGPRSTHSRQGVLSMRSWNTGGREHASVAGVPVEPTEKR